MSRITSFALGLIIAAVFVLLLLISSRTIAHGQTVLPENIERKTKEVR